MNRVYPIAMALLMSASFLKAQTAGEKAASDGQKVVDKALAFLKTQQQENGSWQKSDREPPAISALVLRAMVVDAKFGPTSEPVKKGFAYIASMQQENGGIYKDMLANYNTAISISAMAAAKDPALTPRIEKAVNYLKSVQWSDAIAGANGEKIDDKHPFFGGWNYGNGPKGGRPDVSNSAIVLEALKDSGLKKDDPAYKNAVLFISKLQNNSETNPAPWAANDGGFVYSTGKNGEGESAAGEYASADGKRLVRSYGSMTYAGMKSMIYAGLSKDDPRVKAAWSWIKNNWTLEEHPGMAANGPAEAMSGIYYYYHTLAKGLAAYGEPVIKDKNDATHDWRLELIKKLASVQKGDGSFTGSKRWMEDNAVISTSFATMALQEAIADLKARPAK